MRPPTVLFDTSCLRDARRDAGIGRYAAQLLTALRRRDDVQVVAPLLGGAPRSEARPYRWLRSQPALAREAVRHRPDVVHAPSGEPAIGIGGDRQVVTVHDVEMWRGDGPPGLRGAALRLHRTAVAARLRRCAAVIAISRVTAEEACAMLDLDPRRIHVIPHGVGAVFDIARSAGDSAHLAAAGVARGEYVIWVGSLRHHDPRKGLDLLLEAMARLGAGAPPLLLVGATGPESERVLAEARRRGVAARAAGRQSDVVLAALYRGALLCVIPSRHEGFGLPMLEAFASGTPVVATDAGNLPDLSGGAARTVRSGDAIGFAAAVGELLAHPQRRAAMRAAGVERAARFSWDRCAEETAAVYATVAAGAPRRR
jgi:alpha-1,3-rhamnosyl/mannosyltransferase